MKKWLPKEERKTILLLSDDIRVHSGIGVMSREIVEQTCGYFNWFQLGAAINHPNAGELADASEEIAKVTGVEDPYVRVLAQNGYGDSRTVRQILANEKIDGILHFTDPRYWIWLYQIEHEIRQKVPMMFYAIWDDLPYPYYNENYYRSDDAIFCISKQTYNIVKQVSRKEPRELPWSLTYIPHGIDTKKFFPIQEDDTENQTKMAEARKALFQENDIDFTVFYNARNLRRKMTSDVLLAYNHFLKQLPKEEAEKCRMVMHTAPVDEAGTDLPAVIRDVVPDIKVIFSKDKVNADMLNSFYNIADVTINLASNEGFGLGTCESMLAGTPIIVNVTGGMQDQCGFKNDDGEYLDPERDYTYEWGSNHDGRFKDHGEWVLPVWPVSRSLQGSPLTPYIFDDRCSWEEAGDKIMEVYKMTREERKRRGELGRQYALNEGMFSAEKMGELFIEHMDRTFENWKPRQRYTLIKG
jgi:glycosyltransferase involved in cell wall biosynthesis